MKTEFNVVVVGLVTLFMVDVCANATEKIEHKSMMLNAAASCIENFIFLFHLPKNPGGGW